MTVPTLIEPKLKQPVSAYTVEELSEILAESFALRNMLCVDFEDFPIGAAHLKFFAPQGKNFMHFNVPVGSEILVKPHLTPVKPDKHLLFVRNGDMYISLNKLASRIDLHINGHIDSLIVLGTNAIPVPIPASTVGEITRITVTGENLSHIHIRGNEINIAKLCYLPQP